MAPRIFRFYSLEPEAVFRLAAENWPTAIVRRSGSRIGGSPIFYVTVVLDDLEAADEFHQWLVRKAPRRDIRRYVGRAGLDRAGAVYEDVAFHRGGMASLLKLLIYSFLRDVGGYWQDGRQRAVRLWLRLRS